MEHVVKRARFVLVVFAVWLALANSVAWAGWQRGLWGYVHFDVPIAPGRSLHIHVGELFVQSRLGIEPFFASSRPTFKPLRIAVRYRTGPGWQGRQLFITYLPTWPVIVVTPAVVVALLLAASLPPRVWKSRPEQCES